MNTANAHTETGTPPPTLEDLIRSIVRDEMAKATASPAPAAAVVETSRQPEGFHYFASLPSGPRPFAATSERLRRRPRLVGAA